MKMQIDYQKYLQMGYSMQDIQEAVTEIQNEERMNPLQQSYNKAVQMNATPMNQSNTLVASAYNQDLVRWQLELESTLERVEHILRGDKPKMENGNLIFVPAIDESDKMFNDKGVADIMQILTMYLNKNTILSNYEDDIINTKILDFGKALSNYVFMKYETIGLNTLNKRKRYEIIVLEIVDTVHSAYLRAWNGGERESLRTARTISQSENLMPSGVTVNTNQPTQERGFLNPMRYIKGKF
jgi:hypothetical protein